MLNCLLSYSFLIALVNLSPGNFRGCPIFKPVKTFTVDSVNFCNPIIEIPPSIYSLPFSYTIFFCTVMVSFLTTAVESLSTCALVGKATKVSKKVKIIALNMLLFCWFNLLASFSKSSFSILIFYNCIIKMLFSKIWPKYICKI